jgi:hypothetical protein
LGAVWGCVGILGLWLSLKFWLLLYKNLDTEVNIEKKIIFKFLKFFIRKHENFEFMQRFLKEIVAIFFSLNFDF